MKKLLVGLILLAISGIASAQLIYGNTFPYWNVNGPLTVTGTSTLSGTNTLSGPTTVSGTFTSNAGQTLTGGLTSTANTLLGATTIAGTTTNDSAAAGKVGEFITATVTAGSPVTGAATTVSKNLTSISLTAGDWDVNGDCDIIGSTLIGTVLSCGLGTTTDTQLTQAGGGGVGTDPLAQISRASQTFPDSVNVLKIGPVRVSLASTTTIYLVVNNTFSSGTYNMYGTLRARRIR